MVETVANEVSTSVSVNELLYMLGVARGYGKNNLHFVEPSVPYPPS